VTVYRECFRNNHKWKRCSHACPIWWLDFRPLTYDFLFVCILIKQRPKCNLIAAHRTPIVIAAIISLYYMLLAASHITLLAHPVIFAVIHISLNLLLVGLLLFKLPFNNLLSLSLFLLNLKILHLTFLDQPLLRHRTSLSISLLLTHLSVEDPTQKVFGKNL
jgi:hypothetical protein